MTKIITTLVVLVLGISAPSSTFAYRILAHPDCPGNNLVVSWREYFSKPFPRVDNAVSGIAGVQFRTARRFNEPAAISGLHTNICYVVKYNQQSKTYESYFVPGGVGHEKSNLPGDPMRDEVNVWGVILVFNEAGEIFNYNGDVVGKLVCYLSDECGGY